ncbi:MAG TPA: protein kinase [Pirellulaceae bacterium]|jgi:serine/threonine-protein kinase|nr:protein kinase [Pirellulaceae bacterium]
MSERFGPYEVVRLLGKGGMGSVFEAVHESTGERAAVKILNQQFSSDPHFRARFESEIEAMKQIVHPNIVRLHAFGEQDGKLFYVMEMVPGASLQDRIGQGKRFTAYETSKIGVGICNGLRMAHDRGIIHRDLKPANVMWDGGDVVKLTDFGIAKLFGSTQLTGEGGIIGTVEYMAPEQAAGKPASVRSDLFSLGCVLFAMLSRKTPFAARTIPEILHNVRYKEAPPVSDLVDDVPLALEKLIEKLLNKDPQGRVPTALAVGKRLQEIRDELEPASPEPGAPADEPAPGGPAPGGASLAGFHSDLHQRVTKPDLPASSDPAPAGKTAGGAAASPPTAADGATMFEPKRPARNASPPQPAPPTNVPPPVNTDAPTRASAKDAATGATGEFPATSRSLPGPGERGAVTGAGGATSEFTREPAPRERLAAEAPAKGDSQSFVLRKGTQLATDGSPKKAGAGDAAEGDAASRFMTVEEELAQKRAEEPTPWDATKRSLLIAVPLALAFVVLAGAIILFALPESADDLYGQIMQETGALEPAQYAAAIPEIDEFLRRFPRDSRSEEIEGLKASWSAAKQRKNALPVASGDVLALRPPVQRFYEEALAGVGVDPERSLAQLDALLAAFDERSAGEAGKPFLASARKLRDDLAEALDAQRELERGVLKTRIADEKKRLETKQAAEARAALASLAALYADEPWAAELVAEAQRLAASEAEAP